MSVRSEKTQAGLAEQPVRFTLPEMEKTTSHRLLETVFQTARSAIIALDRAGQVVSLNDAARHVLGGVDDQVPFPWPEDIWFLEPESMARLEASKDPIMRSVAGQELRNDIQIMTRKNGTQNRYVRLSSSRVPKGEDDISTVIVLDDISEQEITRQQMERSSRLDALGQLTGGIAHDFNNLLATIQYSIELALRDISHAPSANLLNTALGTVDRGSGLSRRLLAFARRQPGLAQSKRVTEVRDEFMALIEPTIETNISVSFMVEEPDLHVFCDDGQLENALLNLVLNSRDAITRSGTGNKILIEARAVRDMADDSARVSATDLNAFRAKGLRADKKEDRTREDNHSYRYVELAVTDNGPGMSDEIKRRAVDPFFTTKSQHSGTGLGLSMVYGFVQQSDGELRLYSEEGQGTAVRMMLPRGTPEGAREEPVEREPAIRGHGETILVVEDEVSLLRLMTQALEGIGYKTKRATNGQDALRMVESGLEFDLLLTDIVMPGGINGFALAEQVTRLKPETRVMYMSGYTGYRDTEMGSVIAPILPKPCRELELSRKLRTQLA